MSDNEENGEVEQPTFDYEELDSEGRFKRIERQIHETLRAAKEAHQKENPDDDFDYDGWLEGYQEENAGLDANLIRYVNLYGIYSGDRDEYRVRSGEGETWYPNGDEYKGGFVEGKKHGKGVYLYKSKSQTASFALDLEISKAAEDESVQNLIQNDQIDEAVKEVQKKLNDTPGVSVTSLRCRNVLLYGPWSFYDGEYHENSHHGQGKMKYPNGDYYEGEWNLGFREGFGIMYYINGDIYQGTWVQGKKDGNGSYRYGKTGSVYQGIWKDGQLLSGKWDLKNGVVYEGKFDENHPHDEEGRFDFDDGTRIVGNFSFGRWNPREIQTI